MASVNKVILVGNLGRDPSVYNGPTGTVVNIALATTRNWKNKDSGERQEETEWHRVVFYDRLADIAAEYLKKGKPVYIEGRLKTRKWQDKDGVEKYATEVIASEMQLLGGREGSETAGGGDAPRSQSRGQSSGHDSDTRQPATAPRRAVPAGHDDFEDSIPF
jgi:single-strand DNA-binding protein